ncbi:MULTISPECIES: T9SS type A sorting domain-containing protein [unclassified Saccharicrinis]|uniref:T9SS type A sorting domain-containing protein n=1 Tax=unclassified Saccharicrinis TaxID=2646859 RepID=UPI003D349D39
MANNVIEERVTINFFNNSMSKVKVYQSKELTNTINISDLRTGIYFIQVIYAGQEFTEKIVVE